MVSVIIPCRNKEEAQFCADKCKEQADEVIVIEGDLSPARLRDKGVEQSKGDILAFIDSDAYPSDHWIRNAKDLIESMPWVDAVCGAGVLPPDASFRETLSDLVLRYLPYNYRVIPMRARWVKEFPTFNLLVRRESYNRAGGFNTDLFTGEDSLFCRRLETIFYSPSVLVYHHRRPFGIPFFKQISRYGFNRGFLIAIAFPFIAPLIIITLIIYTLYFVGGLLADSLSPQ